MKPYVAYEFPNQINSINEVLKLAQQFFQNLPDPTLRGQEADEIFSAWHSVGHELVPLYSCHGLCRAFYKLWHDKLPAVSLQVVSGYFSRVGVEHSWIWVWLNDSYPFALDLYPVGGVQPSVVDVNRGSPWRKLYIESSLAFTMSELYKFNEEADYIVRMLKPASKATSPSVSVRQQA